jgi:type II secretory pathway pseudopilin PulG
MVEMLGVLAIIGVLSVGGISGYSKAMAKYKLTKAQDQITMLLMNIRTAFATSPSYDGLTSATAISYNLAPSEMSTSGGTTLYGAFGGEVKVGTVGTTKTYFYIGLSQLGKEACRSLLTSDWGADGLVKITAGPTGTVTAPTDATCTKSIPTAAGAGTWCTANLPVSLSASAYACSGEVNNIVWTYY